MACGAISESLRRSLALDAEISAARHPRKTLADLWIFLKNNIYTQVAGQDIVDFSSRPSPASDPALRRRSRTANDLSNRIFQQSSVTRNSS